MSSANADGFALRAGRKAPEFKLPSDSGKEIRLSDFRGKRVVLYFYPKDSTPGCTREACAFRDGLSKLRKRKAVVLGVSADSVESHRNFKKNHGLNFPLLSDPAKGMLRRYGVWKQKSLYGKRYMGLERTTLIIDEHGKVAKVFPKVKVDGHFEEVLTAL